MAFPFSYLLSRLVAATGLVELITRAAGTRASLDLRCPGTCEPTRRSAIQSALWLGGNCVWSEPADEPARSRPCVFAPHLRCPD